MPNVVFKSVESFSSEDPNFPASNLLAKEARKWKCREAGEKSALVVLRLEKPLTISGVDIGNEHSAFVEVLVARSGPSNPEFKEILLTSSFMSPIESRNSTSTNRVRCFTQAELIESVARCQWDLVKIICTQPFNSRVQYGISFVTLHCPKAQNKHELEKKSLVPDKFKKQIQEEAEKHEAPKAVKLGRFIIREESPDSDEANNSSALFARWKESRGGTAATVNAKVSSNSTNVVSTAAAIRNASTPAAVKNKQLTPVVNRKPVAITPKVKPRLFDDDDEEEEITKPLNRNRESLLYDKDDDKPNEKLEKKMAEDRARIQREKVKSDKEKRDHLLAEKKSKGHDKSVTKFKDFLFEDPPGTASGDSPKKISSSQEKRHRSRSPPTAEKTKHHKRRDSGRDSREEHRERERKPSEQETKKRPSESPRDNSNKKQKHQLSGDEYENRKGKPPTYKHFNKLLENVVLVISGIQNPDRANLRTQALAMGAKYKSDWDSSCTHLICAFKNTPKYNQVHGKGKIVKKGWIERCHALRKRLSWRKFALDSNEAEQSDSEGEIIDISKKPSDLSSFGEKAEVHSSRVKESKRETDEEALSHYDLDDVVLVEDRKPDTVEISGSDTEEEIERVKEMHKKESGNANGVYDKSTEDEGASTTNKGAPLDFFKGQTFFIDSDIGAVDIIKLERYVTLYKGTITKTANEADYVVTRNQKPMGDGFKGQLIKPLWVYECHDMECLIPIQRYQP
ncbi:DNA repair protein XRCC1 [Armigeres subalbatus]|uniref:DNA repair protein XRCC1 n=1 Tax=Armigeres subalbatus TaxID=124917 RepID=UPI002ED17FFD